jgi:type IV secretory pathway TrbD component
MQYLFLIAVTWLMPPLGVALWLLFFWAMLVSFKQDMRR